MFIRQISRSLCTFTWPLNSMASTEKPSVNTTRHKLQLTPPCNSKIDHRHFDFQIACRLSSRLTMGTPTTSSCIRLAGAGDWNFLSWSQTPHYWDFEMWDFDRENPNHSGVSIQTTDWSHHWRSIWMEPWSAVMWRDFHRQSSTFQNLLFQSNSLNSEN